MLEFPDTVEFTARYRRGEAQLIWTEMPADLETPVAAMLKLMPEHPWHLLFESVQGGTRARYSIIALDPDVIWRCDDGKASINRTPDAGSAFVEEKGHPFDSLRALIRESAVTPPPGLPPMATGLFGYMGYDMVRHMERLPDKNPDTIGIPHSLYMRPRITVIFDAMKDIALIIAPVRPQKSTSAESAYQEARTRIARVAETLQGNLKRSLYARYYAGEETEQDVPCRSNTGREQHRDMVERAKEYIRAGDIFQVVLSRRLTRPFTLPPFAFYRALRRLNPSPYLFYMAMGGFHLIGSSPETLVRLRDGTVTIRPIAGTRRRGAAREEDLALEQELLKDEKELAEHLMLLDLGRNDVGRVAIPGSVTVTERMVVERYSHVMHIVSNVEGEIRPGKDCIDALAAGFPAGTVSGAPKIRAMEIIDELEPEKRSFYAGTVGYIAAPDTMDTCIALRTALIKDGTLYLQAGGGIVLDSQPEAEFQETENKAGALVKAAREAVKFS